MENVRISEILLYYQKYAVVPKINNMDSSELEV